MAHTENEGAIYSEKRKKHIQLKITAIGWFPLFHQRNGLYLSDFLNVPSRKTDLILEVYVAFTIFYTKLWSEK